MRVCITSEEMRLLICWLKHPPLEPLATTLWGSPGHVKRPCLGAWVKALAEGPASRQHQSPDTGESKPSDSLAPSCQVFLIYTMKSGVVCCMAIGSLTVPFCLCPAHEGKTFSRAHSCECSLLSSRNAPLLMSCFQIVLWNGCANLYSLQQWTRISWLPASPTVSMMRLFKDSVPLPWNPSEERE